MGAWERVPFSKYWTKKFMFLPMILASSHLYFWMYDNPSTAFFSSKTKVGFHTSCDRGSILFILLNMNIDLRENHKPKKN